MTATETFVIVGAGLAGAKAAEALRGKGFAGRLVLAGAEEHRPYERPPLSKGYLAGSVERSSVFVHAEDWYGEHGVELRLGQSALAVDRAAGQVEFAGGEGLGFDRLLLATGSAPRRLTVPGADAVGVHYLRTLADCDRLQARLAEVSELVVIGAGWIGLEVSAAARQAGVAVTVVESAQLPLLRVLGPELARVFEGLHREQGVDFRFQASVAEILSGGDAQVTGVRLADGTVLAAQAVLVAVGAQPATELAQAAGLAVADGIVVDAGLASSDPRIFAAGDVASAWHPFYQRPLRVEHWANALKQPVTAAASMLGEPAEYAELPYFFTDQYQLGMEYLGYAEAGGYDQVVFRGDVSGREFIAFWLQDRRVIAAMNVNVWDVTDQLKTLIQSRSPMAPDQLADPDTDLSELASQASS